MTQIVLVPIPDQIRARPEALRDYVMRRPIAELAAIVEAGYLSADALYAVPVRNASTGAVERIPIDPARAPLIEQFIRVRHEERVLADAWQRLDANDAGVAHVLGGIDDVDAAVALLDVDPDAWVLSFGALYVKGRTHEQVAAALVATRPEPE